MRSHEQHYEVTLEPEGRWEVRFVSAHPDRVWRRLIASESAPDIETAKIDAMAAIDHDKEIRRKNVERSEQIQHFTVPA